MRILSTLCFLFVVAVLLPQTTHAARMYVAPEQSTYNKLDTFYAPVRVDAQDDCINAVKVDLSYDPTKLSVLDVITGDSILSLWTLTPTIDKVDGKETGRVRFEGGVPGGYCGRIEGDTELTNVLAKLVVTSAAATHLEEESTQAAIVVDPSAAVYLNDGSGSTAPLTVLGADLTLQHSTSSPVNYWLEDISNDVISPEFFNIFLVEGPSEGSNKHYIAFSTTDKQSGIDHYEVLETDPDRFGFLTWVPRESHWVVAESPYELRDQKLRSKILVRAYDKQGNVRTSEYTPPMTPLEQLSNPSAAVPFVLLIVVLLFVVFIVVRLRMKKKNSNETVGETKEETNVEQYEG